MDAQDFRSLQEAYLEVYQEQELDEAITSEKGKAKAAAMIAARSTPSGRAKSGQGANVALIKHIGRSNREGLGLTPPNRKTAGSNRPKSYSGIGGTGNKAARRAAALKKEQVDIYDIILSHLLDEGYAETPEAAQAIMVNMSEEWRDSIVEAEGSYGQTPKATAAYAKLGNERRMKPASEYPKRGDKKKAVSDAERHERSSRRTAADHSGKKSTKPAWHSYQRDKMTQSDRDYLRGQSEYGHIGYDPDFGEPSGPGGMPKGKKLARQKKTGVSAE